MSDTTSSDTTATGEQQPQGDPEPQQLGDGGKKALDAERKAKRDAEKRAAELEARLQQFEDANKTEAQRLTDQMTAAVTRAETAEKTATRLRVALAKGLPLDLADRLRGDSEDDLTADADALLALVNPPQPDEDTSRVPGPRPDMTQGRGSSTPLNGDPLLRDLKTKLAIR